MAGHGASHQICSVGVLWSGTKDECVLDWGTHVSLCSGEQKGSASGCVVRTAVTLGTIKQNNLIFFFLTKPSSDQETCNELCAERSSRTPVSGVRGQ